MSAEGVLREHTRPRYEPATAVVALQAQLQSLRTVIETLSTRAYCAVPSPVSGSIGAHVRHCLDHADAMLAGIDRGEMTYDSRRRGTPVEADPLTAMIEIDRLCFELDDLSERALADPIELQSVPTRGGSPVRVASTVGREVAFVVQHTIHHCAIVAILLAQIGRDVPKGFGYAPSTPGN